MACSRNWLITRGKGGVLIHARMNINYDQTVSKGGFAESNLHLAQIQAVRQTVVTS